MKQLRIGIVGSGFMGQEIGKFLVEKGYPILLKGRKECDIRKFMEETRKIYAKQKRRGHIGQEELERRLLNTTGTLDFDSRFAKLDIVLESTVEDIAVKKEIFSELEARCSNKTIFCSNTSTLSITEIASILKKKERLIGLHFVHPVKFFKITEVIPGDKTSEEAIQAMCSFVREIGKKSLLVKDSPGFFLSRIILTTLIEVFYALESGWGAIEEIDTMFQKSDFLIRPLYSSDITGLDVILHSISYLSQKIPERFSVPSILIKMVEIGRLGRKRGKGFYNYEGGGRIDEEMQSILETCNSKYDKNKPTPFSLEQCLLREMNESIYCLEEGIVFREDVENVIKALPPFLKGLYKNMDNIGINIIYEKLLEFEKKLGVRFKPAPLMVRLVENGWCGVKKGRGFFVYNNSYT